MYIDLRYVTTLTFVFAITRLLGISNWSWVWVISPLWIYGLAVVANFVSTFLRALFYAYAWKQILKK